MCCTPEQLDLPEARPGFFVRNDLWSRELEVLALLTRRQDLMMDLNSQHGVKWPVFKPASASFPPE